MSIYGSMCNRLWGYCSAEGRWNPLREQLVQVLSAFIQAVFRTLVQDELFGLLRPVVNLHAAGIWQARVGCPMHHQERPRYQLPREACAIRLRRSCHDARHAVMHCARGHDHGAAKRVPDEDGARHAALREIGDPGQDIQRACGQDVGVPVAQP